MRSTRSVKEASFLAGAGVTNPKYVGTVVLQCKEAAMSSEENKAIVRRMTEEFYNQGNVDRAEHFFADSYVHHDPASPQVRDRDGLKQVLRAFLAGCPDLHITIDQLLAEDDTVTKRWTYHATQSGDLAGLPPTGKRIIDERVGAVPARGRQDRGVLAGL
jgi:predicted ester cyclase